MTPNHFALCINSSCMWLLMTEWPNRILFVNNSFRSWKLLHVIWSRINFYDIWIRSGFYNLIKGLLIFFSHFSVTWNIINNIGICLLFHGFLWTWCFVIVVSSSWHVFVYKKKGDWFQDIGSHYCGSWQAEFYLLIHLFPWLHGSMLGHNLLNSLNMVSSVKESRFLRKMYS